MDDPLVNEIRKEISDLEIQKKEIDLKLISLKKRYEDHLLIRQKRLADEIGKDDYKIGEKQYYS